MPRDMSMAMLFPRGSLPLTVPDPFPREIIGVRRRVILFLGIERFDFTFLAILGV